MIDAGALRAHADLVEVVGRFVDLRKAGAEYEGLCPFHDERTPSFTVSPAKGFVHCFGCGAHHDVIGFLMRAGGLTFPEACVQLGARDFAPNIVRRAKVEQARTASVGEVWIPVMPDGDSPPLVAGERCEIWNPKRGKAWAMVPSRADAYRDGHGRLLGYVLRTEITDRKTGRASKVTPQVTWCIGPDGSMRWCLRPFARPRPLCGLDELAAKPDAPVLVVEGEKCRASGASALPMYAVTCWPGGSKGLQHVDWSPLADRKVVLWPDADEPGWNAMLGYTHYDGHFHDGVAQLAHAAGARSLRVVDTRGQPKGWDIDDAFSVDGWTAKQLAVWAAGRVRDVEVGSHA